ncbi:MAG: hypothetical protein QM730_14095 [Anaerolineales bacterium]
MHNSRPLLLVLPLLLLLSLSSLAMTTVPLSQPSAVYSATPMPPPTPSTPTPPAPGGEFVVTSISQIFHHLMFPAETISEALTKIFNKAANKETKAMDKEVARWTKVIGDIVQAPKAGEYSKVAQSSLRIAAALAPALFLLRLALYHWGRLLGDDDSAMRVIGDWVTAGVLAVASGPFLDLIIRLGWWMVGRVIGETGGLAMHFVKSTTATSVVLGVHSGSSCATASGCQCTTPGNLAAFAVDEGCRSDRPTTYRCGWSVQGWTCRKLSLQQTGTVISHYPFDLVVGSNRHPPFTGWHSRQDDHLHHCRCVWADAENCAADHLHWCTGCQRGQVQSLLVQPQAVPLEQQRPAVESREEAAAMSHLNAAQQLNQTAGTLDAMGLHAPAAYNRSLAHEHELAARQAELGERMERFNGVEPQSQTQDFGFSPTVNAGIQSSFSGSSQDFQRGFQALSPHISQHGLDPNVLASQYPEETAHMVQAYLQYGDEINRARHRCSVGRLKRFSDLETVSDLFCMHTR